MYEDYYEPSPNDEVVDEIVEIAKGLLSEQIREKIFKLEEKVKTLEQENSKYSDFKETERGYTRRINELLFENQKKYEQGYNDCKKERIDKILDIIEGYTITSCTEYIKPKCNKCNGNREVEFTSPLGRKFKEKCECSERITTYKVSPTVAKTIILNYNGTDTPSRYYLRNPDLKDGKEIRFEYFNDNNIWVFKDFADFEKIKNENKSYWDCVFETKEKAQEYCDYLNELERAKAEEQK